MSKWRITNVSVVSLKLRYNCVKFMKIRTAKRQDWPALKNLINPYFKRVIQTPLPKVSNFFVAEEGKRVVGCCALQVYSKRLAEIRSLVVAKKFQSQGIATRLIHRCLARAKLKGVHEILSITSAVKLFKKNGFKTFNREKFAMLKILGK